MRKRKSLSVLGLTINDLGIILNRVLKFAVCSFEWICNRESEMTWN